MLPNANLPVPQGGAPAPEGGESQMNPAEMESILTEVLGRVKQIADQNGLDFNALVSSVSGGGGSAPVPPVSPSMMGAPAGAEAMPPM